MKQYEQKFEKVFTDQSTLKKCHIDKVSTIDGMDLDTFSLMLRKEINEFQLDAYDHMIKIEWLMRKFCYEGKLKKRFASSGRTIDAAFGVFMRHIVGYSVKMFTQDMYLRRIASYLEDFYVGFTELNPFEKKLEYPYKHMNFECLALVYRMPERIDLLQHGEDKKMNMDQFFDYVINYIHSYNAEHGATYVFYYLKSAPFVTIINE